MPQPFLPVRYRDSCEWLKHTSENGGAPFTVALVPTKICVFFERTLLHTWTTVGLFIGLRKLLVFAFFVSLEQGCRRGGTPVATTAL